MAATAAESFQDYVNDALAPDLPMRLLKEDARVAVYAGLWGTWWPNDEKRLAKVVLATVPKDDGNPKAPPGPINLEALDWLILQLQTFDEECAIWGAALGALLRDDLAAADKATASRAGRPSKGMRLQYNQVTENIQTRQILDPTWFSTIPMLQTNPDDETSTDDDATAARPVSVLNRKRVQYTLPEFENVRVFIEQPVTKQPLQQKLNGNFGLMRESNLLSALNEWRTWIVLDP